MGGFREALPEYGRSFEYMAAVTAWKMRQLYPQLPPDWRIWVFAGHSWMARVSDDIAAGKAPMMTKIPDIFEDDIHLKVSAGYGLASLMLTCLYQKDLRARPRLYRPEGMSKEQQDYFTAIAWEIATDYAPAGMGATRDTGVVWDPATMTDPLADWTLHDKCS